MAANLKIVLKKKPGSEFLHMNIERRQSSKMDFTFLCNDLDSLLNSSTIEDSGVKTDPFCGDTCAERQVPDKSIQITDSKTELSTSQKNYNMKCKQVDSPKYINCFDKEIKLDLKRPITRTIKFPISPNHISTDQTVKRLRLPNELRACYNNNGEEKIEGNNESSLERKPQKRRKTKRSSKLSLLNYDLDDDGVSNKCCQPPTEDDMRSVSSKLFPTFTIPYAYKCEHNMGLDCIYKCARKVRSLVMYMEIPTPNGRPLPGIMRENIAKYTNDSCVTKLAAHIAVTAVRTETSRPSRLFIPVSPDFSDVVGGLLVRNTCDSVADSKLKVSDDVRYVINDILDFVERQPTFPIVDVDPDCLGGSVSEDYIKYIESSFGKVNKSEQSTNQVVNNQLRPVRRTKPREKSKVIRELKRLINVSVTDECAPAEQVVVPDPPQNCNNTHCRMGCVCSSICGKNRPPGPLHCTKFDCMFNCTCDDFSCNYVTRGELAKDEKTWHQTIIRKSNNDLEIKSGVNLRKRETKLPTRYQNSLRDRSVIRRRGRPPASSCSISPTKISPKPAQLVSPVSEQFINSDCDKIMSQSKSHIVTVETISSYSSPKNISRRLGFCSNDEARTLSDVFIWCTLHDIYDCLCANWIVMSKNCNFIHMPFRGTLANVKQSFEKVPLTYGTVNNKHLKIVMFDSTKHCARTTVPNVNYAKRNLTPIYKKKLRTQIKHDVLSNSNGFIKINPAVTWFESTDKEDNYPHVTKSSQDLLTAGEIVHIDPTECTTVIDVVSDRVLSLDDDNMPIENVNDIEVIPKPASIKSPTIHFLPCFSVYKNGKTDHLNVKANNCQSVEIVDSGDNHSESDSSDVEFVSEYMKYDLYDSPIVIDDDIDVDPLGVENNSLEFSSSQPQYDDADSFEDKYMESMNATLTDEEVGYESDENLLEQFNRNKNVNAPKVSLSAEKSSIDPLAISKSVNIVAEIARKRQLSKISSGRSSSPKKRMHHVVEKNEVDICKKNEIPNKKIKLVYNQEIRNFKISSNYGKAAPTTPSLQGTTNSQKTMVVVPLKPKNSDPKKQFRNDYPKLGLFCMSRPELGYVTIKEWANGKLLIEDPNDISIVREFKDHKCASEFLNKLSPKLAKSKWVTVTRGVLEKYNSKKFDIMRFPYGASNSGKPVASSNKNLKKKIPSVLSTNSPVIKSFESENEQKSKQISKPATAIIYTKIDGKLSSSETTKSTKITDKQNFAAAKSTEVNLPNSQTESSNTFHSIGEVIKDDGNKQAMSPKLLFRIAVPTGNIKPTSIWGESRQILRVAGSSTDDDQQPLVNVLPSNRPKTALVQGTFNGSGQLAIAPSKVGFSKLETSTNVGSQAVVIEPSTSNTPPEVTSSTSCTTLAKSNTARKIKTWDSDLRQHIPPEDSANLPKVDKGTRKHDKVKNSNSSKQATIIYGSGPPAHKRLALQKSTTNCSSSSVIKLKEDKGTNTKTFVPALQAEVIITPKERTTVENQKFPTPVSTHSSTISSPAHVKGSDNKVYNGVLVHKSDNKKVIKGYICDKKYKSKTTYRSLLQKR